MAIWREVMTPAVKTVAPNGLLFKEIIMTEQLPQTNEDINIDDLIAAGYRQVSRKYRRLARPTEKESNPHLSEDFIELSPNKFSEYQKRIGNTGWLPKQEPCPECETLGNIHRIDCSYRK